MPEHEFAPLITECPGCRTRFRVTRAQLERASGRVRCGACLTIFDGAARLALPSNVAVADEDAVERTLDEVLEELAGDSGERASPPDAVAPGGESDAAVGARMPFGEPGSRRRPWVWAGIVLASAALMAQTFWYQFDDWARDPFWRGTYAAACDVLGCRLPVQRDTSLLGTRNLVVRSHSERSDALRVDAVIVNEAPFPQPFPVLELRFTTAQGALVAGRRFQPEAYLAGDAEGASLIPPKTPVQIELTVDDPGPHAVNYFLRYR
ncbi:MAG: zinc-ribbon and DUF3426 domain-containing protein [Pseudomonadota bacterium]